MRSKAWSVALVCGWFSVVGLGCSSSSSPAGPSDSGSTSIVDAGSLADTGVTAESGGGDGGETLCAKYGGQPMVAAMIPGILGVIAGDCRVDAYFATLGMAKINHIADCMVNQVGGLFQCPGVVYAGSVDTKGVACLDMKTAHMGMGLSVGDFNALVDDIAKGLTMGGVSAADIQSAAPALMGMEPDIVESTATSTTRGACDGGTESGTTDAAGD
jgi:hemoglobin